MNIEELRVGDWIVIDSMNAFEQPNTPLRVSIDMFVALDRMELFKDQLQPIPLSPEILIKAGFFKYNNAYVLKEPSTNMAKFEFSIWENITYNTGEIEPPFDYVHQLQNLYFALTGKELDIIL